MKLSQILGYILISTFVVGLSVTLFSPTITSEQFRISIMIEVTALAIGAILLVVGRATATSTEVPALKAKDDTTVIPSKSGVVWTLPRKLNWHEGRFPDSRSFLEKQGFVILGIKNKMLYKVEPPIGWIKEKSHPVNAGHYWFILNLQGEVEFEMFANADNDDYYNLTANITGMKNPIVGGQDQSQLGKHENTFIKVF